MDLNDILNGLDEKQITHQEAYRLLEKHLPPRHLAVALLECRAQRNEWREKYNAREETP